MTVSKELSRKIQSEHIPATIRNLHRWACWIEVPPEKPGGKPDKPPIDAGTSIPEQIVYASSNNPETWTTYKGAYDYWESNLRRQQPPSGLSFALCRRDGLVGIDLDDCRNSQTGEIEPWAREIIRRINSYTEVSPSGTGIRIFVKGKLPQGHRCKQYLPGGGCIEVYSSHKFLTVTGNRVTEHGAGEDIEDRTSELLTWHGEVFGPSTSTEEKNRNSHSQPGTVNGGLTESRLQELLTAKPKARAIFEGNHSYHSQSEADLALANIAVWQGWTDGEVVELLRGARDNSGAGDKHHTYYTLTIDRARKGMVEYRARTARNTTTPVSGRGRVEMSGNPSRRESAMSLHNDGVNGNGKVVGPLADVMSDAELAAADAAWREADLLEEADVEPSGGSTDPVQPPMPSERSEAATHTWVPIPLSGTGLRPQMPPPLLGCFYGTERHVLFGEAESLKSWIALAACTELIKHDRKVVYIDHETTHHDVDERLVTLGCSQQQVRDNIIYMQPGEPLDRVSRADVKAMLDSEKPELVVVDAFTGSLSIHGRDDNATADVDWWWREVAGLFWDKGKRCLIIIDHTPKTPGSQPNPIGSQRKISGADVALAVTRTGTLTRTVGSRAVAKLTIRRDRPARLVHPVAGEIQFEVREPGKITYRALAVSATSLPSPESTKRENDPSLADVIVSLMPASEESARTPEEFVAAWPPALHRPAPESVGKYLRDHWEEHRWRRIKRPGRNGPFAYWSPVHGDERTDSSPLSTGPSVRPSVRQSNGEVTNDERTD
jgi:hypothetical protein